jgi:hypothetical protein
MPKKFRIINNTDFRFLPLNGFKGIYPIFKYFVNNQQSYQKKYRFYYYPIVFFLPISFIFLGYDYYRKKKSPYNVKEAKSKKKSRENMFKILDDTFLSAEIKRSSKHLIIKIFKDKEVLDSLVGALTRAVRNEAFLDQSKIWSKDWIMTILKSDQLKYDVKVNILKILKSSRTKNEASNYVKEIVLDEEFKQFIAKIMKQIWLRDDVLGRLSSLFEKCALSALKTDTCKNKGSDLFLIIWRDNNFKNYVYTKSLSFWVNEQNGFSPTIQNTTSIDENPSYDYILKNLFKNPKP